MGAFDPTYPLYPVACILAAVMLLLVMLTSFIRQSFNLGVAFLCIWLFLENIAGAVNTVLWSGNADLRLYAYCDVVSHLCVFCYVVKPMSTLIITRRLYLIASLRSVDLPSKSAMRGNLMFEWALGLGLPLIVAGPLYYLVQDTRFKIFEGFGCNDSPSWSILALMLLPSWSVIPPLVSISVYYPRVARIFYRQSKDINRFLQSNNSVSRINYIRILMLASIDIVLTLPVGVAYIALNVLVATEQPLPFYPGWDSVHGDWAPKSVTYAELEDRGTSAVVLQYFQHWTSTILAFAIFGLFGMTAEARASYWRMLYTIASWFNWEPVPHRPTLDIIEFGYDPGEASPSPETESIESYPDHIAERGPTMVDCDAEERGYARAEFDAAFSASYQWTVRTNVKSQLSILDSIHTV